MKAEITYTATARDDLHAIFLWIADATGADIAFNYVQRIEQRCQALRDFPEQGTPRFDLVDGLRTLSFERNAVIAYRVAAGEVSILRILRRGREVGQAFPD